MGIIQFVKQALSGEVRVPIEVQPATLEELIEESQELGRQIDALRERRRVIKDIVARQEAERIAALPPDAVMGG